ncbi:MAG TPA: hypothetical protein VH325_17475 [Bryobacteraceae bacterium]|jgi:hypothetical protein|nr:hypothetical protein [Bryobacteraceae bacterium]
MAHASSVSFTVDPNGNQFSGPAPSGLSLPSGDKSFTASFSPGSGNSNVTPGLTLYGTPGVLSSQGSALGSFKFSDSTASSQFSNYGPIYLQLAVTVGSASTTLNFDGNLVTSGNNLYVQYSPTAGQTTESLYFTINNVLTPVEYVVQYFDGYAFGIAQSTLADQNVIDSKQVAIDGLSSAAPEPATFVTLGLTGLGLLLIGRVRKRPAKE